MNTKTMSLLAAVAAVSLAGGQRPAPRQAGQEGSPRALPSASWEQLLRLDADGDGRIGRDEFRGPPPWFDRLDQDGDGFVVKAEFEAGRAAMAARMGPAARAGGGAPAASPPTHANVVYGPHGRNVLDFWQAESSRPAPLAVFIHGGGFVGGGKEKLNPRERDELLRAGISVASLNYRLLAQAPLPAAHQDVARAIQYLRGKAGEWNIDKSRIGGFGGSAGAQLAMYLAFHDDLADPGSADPVARESTRLACVAPNAGQATMDMRWWDEHVPGYAERAQQRRTIEEMFGTGDEAQAMDVIKRIAALALVGPGDPPIYMTYTMAPGDAAPDGAREQGWMIHHVVHGVELKKLCDRFGVEAHLQHPGAQARYASATAFLKAKLLGEAPRDAAGRPGEGEHAFFFGFGKSMAGDAAPLRQRGHDAVKAIEERMEPLGFACRVFQDPPGQPGGDTAFRVSSKGVEDELEAYRQGLGTNDTLIVYSHSHGLAGRFGGLGGLVLDEPGGDGRRNRATLDWARYADHLLGLPAKTVVVLAMACHSGGLVDYLDNNEQARRRWQARKEEGRNFLVITSQNAQALSNPRRIGGTVINPFTHAVIKAFEGEADAYRRGDAGGTPDGRITLGELADFVVDETRRHTSPRDKDNDPDPQLTGSFDRETVVALVSTAPST